MISQNLALVRSAPLELLVLFWICGFWLLMIILPVIYVVHSISTRRKILTQIQELGRQVSLLRQKLEPAQSSGPQDQTSH